MIHCSYLKDCENNEFYRKVFQGVDRIGYAKCLLLLDSIRNTEDKIKKTHYRVALEIELLVLMDFVNYSLEQSEENLQQQNDIKNKAKTRQEEEYWNPYIAETQEKIENLHLVHSELETLLNNAS